MSAAATLTTEEAVVLLDELLEQARRAETLIESAAEAVSLALDATERLYAMRNPLEQLPVMMVSALATGADLAGGIVENLNGRAYDGVAFQAALQDVREMRVTILFGVDLARARLAEAARR